MVVMGCWNESLFQPVLHKGHGMRYPVLHIKDPLLLIKNSPYSSSSGFPLSLYEQSFTMFDAI